MDRSSDSSNGQKVETAASSGTSPKQVEAASKALNLMVQGRRHLLVSDVRSAITALAESCQLLGEQYGETANECAESYYYYGVALLEAARQESNVLGDAVDGGGEKNEDEEVSDASDDQEERDGSESGEEDEDNNEENGSTNNTNEPGEGKDVQDAQGKGKSLKVNSCTTQEEGVKPEEEGESEDVSNLQLAWEVLELAKQIYERHSTTDESVKPRLADTLVRLAEVSIESENYTSAIEDLKCCLNIQNDCLPPDSRSLAETYYQLGVAYTFTAEFDKAIENFEAASNVIQKRITNLKSSANTKEAKDESHNAFYTVEGEIEELTLLLPDIREKVADTIDLQNEAQRKLKEIAESCNQDLHSASTSSASDIPSTSGAVSDLANTKPALDISHLIRKKRKVEEGASEPVPKKVCSDTDVVES